MKKNYFWRRFLILTFTVAALIASIATIITLLIIASYRLEYGEYMYMGCQTLADQVHMERLAFGDLNCYTRLLYNLPFLGKMIMLIFQVWVMSTSARILNGLFKIMKKKLHIKKISR